MHIDDSEARALATKLDNVETKVWKQALPVMRKAALNIKNGLADDAKRSRHFKQIAPSISYDERSTFRGAAWEIGPDKDSASAGHLANLAYFGGANGGGGTLDFDKPGREEIPAVEAYLAKVLGEALS